MGFSHFSLSEEVEVTKVQKYCNNDQEDNDQ